MKIEVEKLPKTGASFVHTYTPDELAVDDERARLSEPLQAEFYAQRKRDEVEARGVIKGELEATCDRCLRPVKFPIETKFHVTYAPSDAEIQSEAHELRAEDLERVTYENGVIDLDELTREQVLLEIPTRILCQEDCKGLCPTCRANLNDGACGCEAKAIDPRWSSLAALKEK